MIFYIVIYIIGMIISFGLVYHYESYDKPSVWKSHIEHDPEFAYEKDTRAISASLLAASLSWLTVIIMLFTGLSLYPETPLRLRYKRHKLEK